MYERIIIKELLTWKESPYHKPLILRGARQVGKTTAVNLFSRYFDQYLYFNLETTEDKDIFERFQNIHDLVKACFFIRNKEINHTSTLIFIDEIQEVPKALTMLRYFYEDYPNLHVIAAGSLLESLFNNKISFPVGRVEYRIMYPFTFREFLDVMGETTCLQQYESAQIAPFAHHKLLKLFHDYTLIGGMPEIVQRYAKTHDFSTLKIVYESLILSYLDDVEKYAHSQTQIQAMRHVIKASFSEAGNRIKFQNFGQSVYSSREMGEALRTLEKAMLLRLIYPTTQTSQPYASDIKKSPRLQILDTGMLNFFSGLQTQLFGIEDLNNLYQGRISEHITGQELLANQKSLLDPLRFWVREKKESVAEIDFLFSFQGNMIPVEVKSGATGRLRSLHLYMDMSEQTTMAIRLYAGEPRIDKLETPNGKKFELHNLPYYLAGNIETYLNSL